MTDMALSSTPPRRELTEDWLAVWVGLLIFALALAGLAGRDFLGWAVSTSVWTDFSGALKATSTAYPGLGGLGALLATYAALLVVLAIGVAALKGDVKRFAAAFTVAAMAAGSSAITQSLPLQRQLIFRNSA